MQTTFLIELRFWLEDLEAKYYKDHVSKKRIEDKRWMTLQSLKTYRYIGSKTKNYQI